MKQLSDALAGLGAFANGMPVGGNGHTDRLVDLPDFGSNPGNLRARVYNPTVLDEQQALVVVLHGCTQTAAGYDLGAGWSQLADRHGFVLLFPEQRRENNPNLCFNWFLPDDSQRDRGEALSIRQMIAQLMRDRDIDPARIFITGLSAGGAMTSVMLACYPEVFAGGAIIAGLPYGCAAGVPQALARMRGEGLPDAAKLGALLRAASNHAGDWPAVSIWHGSGDMTVSPANADAILAQWRAVHGVSEAPSGQGLVDGHPRRAWRNAAGREVIEEYRIAGLGHGTPLDTRGSDPCGVAGPHMLEASISSTRRIVEFWGIARAGSPMRQAPADGTVADVAGATFAPQPASRHDVAPQRSGVAAGIGKVIEDALRAGGLMR